MPLIELRYYKNRDCIKRLRLKDFDLGEVEPGESASLVFYMRNEGDLALNKVQLESSDKNVEVKIDRDELPVGEVAEIILKWTSPANMDCDLDAAIKLSFTPEIPSETEAPTA